MMALGRFSRRWRKLKLAWRVGLFSLPRLSQESAIVANQKFTDMWGNSKPHEYLSFRVFIFGITNQSMFPNGVIYDGVLDNKPLYFRGESGANDSMVSPFPLPLIKHQLH